MRIEKDITEFRQAFGLPIHEKPTLLSPEDAGLHLELINEEFTELVEAYDEADIVEVFDGIVDMMYVLGGLAVHMGLPLEEGWREVHASNMSKLDENGEPIISDGTDGFPKGKVLKSDTHFQPNLETIVEGASL